MRRYRALSTAVFGLALVGCVVDVDLGRSPVDPPSPDLATPPGPDHDVIPLDASPRPDGVIEPIPDASPSPDEGIAVDAAPDAEPDFIETCAECVDALASTAVCIDDAPCVFEPALIDACGALCEVPDDGSCEGCFDGIDRLLEACDAFAPIAICDDLQIELVSRCDARCGADLCAECLDGVVPACLPDEPLACGEALAGDFAACFDACDGPLIFDGLSCAIDIADAWALCLYAGGGQCDDPLGAGVELCRLLVTGPGAECLETCGALSGVHLDLCRQLGGGAAICDAHSAARIDACFASSCQLGPWVACDVAAQAREQLCDAAEGVGCAGLGQAIGATCTGEFEPLPCQDCLLQALAAFGDCGGVSECLPVLEDAWAACLDACGQTGPAPGCLDCGLFADDEMGRCVLDGTDAVSCIARRDGAAAACAPACGDALPRGLPCSVRTQALWDACPADPDDDPLCFEAGAAFDAACHWARLGVE